MQVRTMAASGPPLAQQPAALSKDCRFFVQPTRTTSERLARIIGDVATLAFKWNKPLAARLLPSPGRKVGEMTEFGGQLRNTIIQPFSGTPSK